MAEPGILFWDKINSWHLMSGDPEFEFAGVNPCAEEPLPPWVLYLASINLSEFVKIHSQQMLNLIMMDSPKWLGKELYI